jgi:hypothetical protein
MIRSQATTLVALVTAFWSLGCKRAEDWGILLANWLRPFVALLSGLVGNNIYLEMHAALAVVGPQFMGLFSR